jgi:hypothetical protein
VADLDIHSLLIVRHGYLVLDTTFEFLARFDGDRIHFSVRDKTRQYGDHDLKGQAQR